MKKVLFALFVLLCIASAPAFAQTPFEGTMKAKVEAVTVPEEMKGMEAMMSSTMTLTMKGDQSKVESQSAMGTTTVLMDYKKHESILLMDMMGNKTAVKETLEEDEVPGMSFEMQGGKFEATTQTKTIAGHKCTLYKVSMQEEGESVNVEVWIATDFKTTPESAGMPGTPFEYTFSTNGITMTYTVLEVSAHTVPASAFTIPEGYTVQTREEFEKQYPMLKD